MLLEEGAFRIVKKIRRILAPALAKENEGEQHYKEVVRRDSKSGNGRSARLTVMGLQEAEVSPMPTPT